MREHDLAEFELERDSSKVKLRKHPNTPQFVAAAPRRRTWPTRRGAAARRPTGSRRAGADVGQRGRRSGDHQGADRRHLLPVVGACAKPFADVGEQVRKGQVLCIIEAMKLMNEINAECDGEVVKVYVRERAGRSVRRALFAVKPA
jgi:biotin carboxyl carrier protein